MTCRLVTPSLEWKDAYLDFYKEWVETREEMIPWVIGKEPNPFQSMVQDLEDTSIGKGLEEGWVPASTFWFVNKENRVIGVVNIRHSLTALLYDAGGHIGYGIRPSERKKGYATELLRQSLQKAKQLGVKNVLLVCDETNTGSMKTILNNGAVEAEDFIEEDGNIVKRYWITT